MIVNDIFIPKYIFQELLNPDTKISIGIGWEVMVNNDVAIVIFHEKHGLLEYSHKDLEFDFIKRIVLYRTISVRDIDRDILLGLWSKELFFIDCGESYCDIPSRYRHFFEYLSRYGSKSLSPYKMFHDLNNSKVAIVGIGGLGASLAVLLSSHGVGSITLIDGDILEESNLTRQVFYKHKDIGSYKTNILANHIMENNPNTNISCISSFILSYNDANNFLQNHDFVILCADEPRFKIKAWVGKSCFVQDIPLLIMANGWIGPVLVKDKSPCYACLGRYHASQTPYMNLALHVNETQIPPRASFGPQPFVVGGYMSSIVLMYLTGIDRETFLNKRMRLNFFGIGSEEYVTRYFDCKICGLNNLSQSSTITTP